VEEDNIGVRCVGGPRVRVLQQEEVHVRDGAPPMKRATELVLDHDGDDNKEDLRNTNKIPKTSGSLTKENDNGINSADDDNTNADVERNIELEQQKRESLAELRGRCLELLSNLTSHKSIMSLGIPPLDAEEFSFWALRFVLAYNDVPSRHKWLSCHSTRRRLGFVVGLLDEFKQVKKRQREQNDRASCTNKE